MPNNETADIQTADSQPDQTPSHAPSRPPTYSTPLLIHVRKTPVLSSSPSVQFELVEVSVALSQKIFATAETSNATTHTGNRLTPAQQRHIGKNRQEDIRLDNQRFKQEGSELQQNTKSSQINFNCSPNNNELRTFFLWMESITTLNLTTTNSFFVANLLIREYGSTENVEKQRFVALAVNKSICWVVSIEYLDIYERSLAGFYFQINFRSCNLLFYYS